MSAWKSAVFENDRRHSIGTISLLRVKAREWIEIIILKNINRRKSMVREERIRWNMPRIIQCGVFRECLREEFSFRDREDSCGAIRKKQRWESSRSKIVGDIFGKVPERSGS